MFDDENVELNAVTRIKAYFDQHPDVRSLSARQRHTLKFHLKDKIRRFSGHFNSPEQIPEDQIRLDNLVEHTRNHPVLA